MFEIGSSLRAARVRQKLELSQVERETRIRPKYLRALEDEDFAVLPGPAYAKGVSPIVRRLPRSRWAALCHGVQRAGRLRGGAGGPSSAHDSEPSPALARTLAACGDSGGSGHRRRRLAALEQRRPPP